MKDLNPSFPAEELRPDERKSKNAKSIFTRRNVSVLLLSICVWVFSLTQAQASHFRYGNISWRVVSGNTIAFKVSQAWRYSAFYPSLGQTIQTDFLYFGNGNGMPINLQVTAINMAEDWFYGETTITYTYPAAGNYTAYFTSCCKISTLQNNRDADWRVETVVNVGSGNNAPVTTSPAIINLPVNLASAATTLAVTDPDGDPLSFRLATFSEMQGVNPAGLTVNGSGVITFNTVGKTVGQLWNAAVVVTDARGAKVVLDFIIKITQQSTPPEFDYAVTPGNGTVFQVVPGQAVSFSVRASDRDGGDQVLLQAVGLPVGASLSPALPTSGNPVQSAFSWTPTAGNLGTNVISFIAQDQQGVQTTTSVTILISLKPIFEVPPTPAANSYAYIGPGTPLSRTIQAADPDPNDRVQIISAGVPAGALFPALPTAAANPVTAQLSWTPQPSDWGEHVLRFTAQDTYGDKTNHTFSVVVNSPPAFSSTPATTSIVAGQQFQYAITATDADLPFGDVLQLVASGLPAWLSLTDHGNGTATLSGTPQVADAGTFPVTLLVQDRYYLSGGQARQAFSLEVIPCNMSLAVNGTPISCHGKRDGSIALTVTGGTAPFTFSWTGPDGYTSAAENPAGLAAGTYSVVVKDANNCQETIALTLHQPPVELPRITGPAGITVPAEAGICGAVVHYTAPVGTHSCHAVLTSRTAGLASGATFPVGETTVSYTVTDGAGNTASHSFVVKVVNGLPAVGAISPATTGPVPLTTTVSASAAFTDDNLVRATWDWGDGATSAGTIGATSITGSHSYAAAGVYTVGLTLQDACNSIAATTYQYVVVYDPNGGFVTGGGWIQSPAGAYKPDPALTGRANFGFVSKYQKGAQVPIGETNFEFQTAGLHFKSSHYEWLVVSGAAARYKGEGTINGSGRYGFLLAATDGQLTGGGADKFRIKIWDKNAQDRVVYDNNLGANGDDALAETALAGGAIVVHEAKKARTASAPGNRPDGEQPAGSDFYCYPTVFSDKTTVVFSPELEEAFELAVFDLKGMLVKKITSGRAAAHRRYAFSLSSEGLAEGLYIVRLTTPSRVQSLKAVVRR